MREGDIELLQHIAEFEDSHPDEFNMGWTFRHVRVQPATLNRLYMEGYLDNVMKTNSYTGYCLSERGRKVVEGEQTSNDVDDKSFTVPDDLFQDIIGHDDVKQLLRACLVADEPVHVLLAGPPALAKTLFLWDIENTCGEMAAWLLGSGTSKAGLWDMIAEKQPYIILIDELDKMNAADMSALLSMMEGGRLVRAKKGRELNLTRQIRVVAATNRLDVLSPELKSRFAKRELKPYGRQDYLTVVQGVLTHKENVDPQIAEEIARRLDGLTKDVRDAVRVARLAPQLGVAEAVRLLLGSS